MHLGLWHRVQWTFLALMHSSLLLVAGELRGELAVAAAGKPGPRIETDARRLKQIRSWLDAKREPYQRYWKSSRVTAEQALLLGEKPEASRYALKFHQAAQEQGIAARLLAYWWWWEGN
jgi:hypothetical protein